MPVSPAAVLVGGLALLLLADGGVRHGVGIPCLSLSKGLLVEEGIVVLAGGLAAVGEVRRIVDVEAVQAYSRDVLLFCCTPFSF